jgi:hypothetical protein
MLREARQALPTPDELSTERVRRRVLAALGPRRARTRTRALVLVAATLVTAVLLGVTASSLNAPSVTAAREPAVLGFVPEPGWYALQSPPAAVAGQQTASVAANVPFAADDVENGLVEPSGLPYATLLELPADGIVIVATMTPQSVTTTPPVPTWLPYTEVELPLRLRDAMPVLLWGAQVRPDQPLAQYHLSGSLHGYNVDVVVYFGTSQPSSELMREAQRQLAGFVSRPGASAPAPAKAAKAAAPSATTEVIDRTYACETVLLGGIYEVEVRAHRGDNFGTGRSRLPYAGVFTGGNAGRIDTQIPPGNALAWMAAGKPLPQSTVDDAYDAFLVPAAGTLGRNTTLCRPTSARVALSRAGLRGGLAPRATQTVECGVSRQVLIRVRATALGSAELRDRGRTFAATGSTLTRAELAVRTPDGRRLAYATVDRGGRSWLYRDAKRCDVQ